MNILQRAAGYPSGLWVPISTGGPWRTSAELLLPCNVIIYETDDGKAYVAAINPVSALEIIKSRELRVIAEEVAVKLKNVIEKAGG